MIKISRSYEPHQNSRDGDVVEMSKIEIHFKNYRGYFHG